MYRVCQHQKKLRSGGGDRCSARGTGDRGSNLGSVDGNDRGHCKHFIQLRDTNGGGGGEQKEQKPLELESNPH
ncbi:hypothetical protein ACLKA6_018744 [Drosophila palustris]